MHTEWKDYWSSYKYRQELYLSLVCWLVIVAIHPIVLEFVEFRNIRLPLNDWLLNILPCTNFSTPIFMLLYSVCIYGIASCIQRPALLLFALQSYMLVQFVRLCTLLLLPLDSPANLEPLRDPLLEFTFYKGNCYTRDLFFSGHVATMATFYFLEYKPLAKKILLAAAIAMSVMILIQHIHYSIDVVGGWLAAYYCNRLMLNKNFIKLKVLKLTKIWKP